MKPKRFSPEDAIFQDYAMRLSERFEGFLTKFPGAWAVEIYDHSLPEDDKRQFFYPVEPMQNPFEAMDAIRTWVKVAEALGEPGEKA